MLRNIRPVRCITALAASCVLAFGLYHIHSFAGVTEGGVLGATLLLQHWWGLSPSVSGFVLNAVCYVLGWRVLGKHFVFYSALATASFSVSYAVFERFPPLWPQLYQQPLLAAVLGALFVGVGAGLCVWAGGAVSGDDALAMAVSHLTRWPVQYIYLISDLLVLGLSVTYIPLGRLWYSLLTVVLSGQIIGLIQRIPQPKERPQSGAEQPEETA